MIKRYSTEKMTAIWSDLSKYKAWLQVELAVLEAMVDLKQLPSHVCRSIEDRAYISEETVKRIEKIDIEIHHDLLAFVQAVQEQLPAAYRQYFHRDLTSYDTEEPALSLQMQASIDVLVVQLVLLLTEIKKKALKYKNLVRIARTHGQQAEPSTLGLMFLWWYDRLDSQLMSLADVSNLMYETKISGAVGTYSGRLSPKLEKIALNYLGLKPARISGQIILRDRHARVMMALGILASLMENIAENIRILGQTEIREVQEPFGKKRKGSSRMPHKKNPVLSENLCGLARIVRSNVAVALENIVTWDSRDIAQSSAERIIFVDSFQAVHFMLIRLTKVIKGLVINKDQIKKNLELTKGIYFSPEVKEALMDSDYAPEEAYRISQSAAFKAIEQDKTYKEVLAEDIKITTKAYRQMKKRKTFDLKKKLKYVDDIYKRFDFNS